MKKTLFKIALLSSLSFMALAQVAPESATADLSMDIAGYSSMSVGSTSSSDGTWEAGVDTDHVVGLSSDVLISGEIEDSPVIALTLKANQGIKVDVSSANDWTMEGSVTDLTDSRTFIPYRVKFEMEGEGASMAALVSNHGEFQDRDLSALEMINTGASSSASPTSFVPTGIGSSLVAGDLNNTSIGLVKAVTLNVSVGTTDDEGAMVNENLVAGVYSDILTFTLTNQ